MNLYYTFEDPEKVLEESIFLAGPTYRDENLFHLSWRNEIIQLLRDKSFYGDVFIPEWKENKKPENWNYEEQVKWEVKYLNASSVILFWIPRNLDTLPAFTTNIEFGEWLHSGKIVAGGPKEAVNNEYLIERCRLLNIPWSYSQNLLIDNALYKLFGDFYK